MSEIPTRRPNGGEAAVGFAASRGAIFDQARRPDGDRLGPVEVLEYTDPFCPWAWSTEPKLRRLRLALGATASWRRVLGILVDGRPETSTHADAAAEIDAQYARWADVTVHTGAPVPLQLQWPVSSSWPASQAVKAAEQQGAQVADIVLRRLRESLYLAGRPGDSVEAIAEALGGTPGLDDAALLDGLEAAAIRVAVEADWDETRTPHSAVIGLTEPAPHPGGAAPDGDRLPYRFPTLVIRGPEGTALVPGWRSYDTYTYAVGRVAPGISIADGRVPDGDDALDLFETLTRGDIDTLTTAATVPTRAVAVATTNGPVWARPERAAAFAGRPAGQASA